MGGQPPTHHTAVDQWAFSEFRGMSAEHLGQVVWSTGLIMIGLMVGGTHQEARNRHLPVIKLLGEVMPAHRITTRPASPIGNEVWKKLEPRRGQALATRSP